MTMAYHNRIHYRDILDVARLLRMSFRPKERKRTASLFKDGIKEHTQTSWEFDIVARMAQPGCSKGLRSCPTLQKGRFNNRDCWRCCIGSVQISREFPPERSQGIYICTLKSCTHINIAHKNCLGPISLYESHGFTNPFPFFL